MKRTISIALLLAGTVLLAGCPKKHNVNEPPVAGTQVPESSANGNGEGASTSTSPLDGQGGGDAANIAKSLNAAPLSKKIIYFEFDKSEIKPDYADIITTAASNLTGNPTLKLKLEGNTDNRGTREYNIGLGERRAQAVRRALMLQGVAESQLSTTSFGAERPAAEGDDESAWSQNRRVELVYGP
jgi:peptidoglycan-associated lipoprotein